ncbi:MAG: hypothetical protein E6J20_04080 [Chloroflexi bacterium]|nr:MAG: hypothetical protein E6J20_04080 [Chloroflexota bacterium]
MADLASWLASLVSNGKAVLQVATSFLLLFGGGGYLFGFHVPQLPAAIQSLLPPRPATMPAQGVVIVSSDDLMANSYNTLLNDLTLNIRVNRLDTSQIDALPDYKPGLVIIGSSNPQTDNLNLSPAVMRFLSGNVKVLGVGVQGAFILNQIAPGSPLTSRNSVGLNNSEVILGHGLSSRMLARLPAGGSFHLYSHDDTEPGVAIYDGGSLENQGARGIARVWDAAADECSAHYWAVATQGNNALWGYTLNANELTPEGSQLFVNTVEDMLETPFASQESQQQQYFPPGPHNNRSVGCHYPSNTYRIRVGGTGTMHIGVQSKSNALQVKIFGPLNTDTVVKPAGRDIQIPVSQQSLDKGREWTVTVIYTGAMTVGTTIYYDLTLDYQSSSPLSVHEALWVIGMIVAGALAGIIALAWLFLRHVWPRLPRHQAAAH